MTFQVKRRTGPTMGRFKEDFVFTLPRKRKLPGFFYFCLSIIDKCQVMGKNVCMFDGTIWGPEYPVLLFG